MTSEFGPASLRFPRSGDAPFVPPWGGLPRQGRWRPHARSLGDANVVYLDRGGSKTSSHDAPGDRLPDARKRGRGPGIRRRQAASAESRAVGAVSLNSFGQSTLPAT